MIALKLKNKFQAARKLINGNQDTPEARQVVIARNAFNVRRQSSGNVNSTTATTTVASSSSDSDSSTD